MQGFIRRILIASPWILVACISAACCCPCGMLGNSLPSGSSATVPGDESTSDSVDVSAADNAKAQDRFFVAAQSGDVNQVLALFHPELREEIDDPMLAAYLKEMNEKLGEYKGMSWTDFSVGTEWVNGMSVKKAEGKFNFESGSADAEFEYTDGQLTKFNIVSSKMKNTKYWRRIETDIYEKRAEALIRLCMSGAKANEFDTDRNVIKPEDLAELAGEIHKSVGDAKEITLERSEVRDIAKVFEIVCRYYIVGENGNTNARVVFVPTGLMAVANNVKFTFDDKFEPIGQFADELENNAQEFVGQQLLSKDLANTGELIDPPVRLAITEMIAEDFGEPKSKPAARTTVEYEFSDAKYRSVTTRVTVPFEEKSLAIIVAHDANPESNNRIRFFEVEDAQWIDRLKPESYNARTASFLEAIFTDEAALEKFAHPNLLRAASTEKIMEMGRGFTADKGKFESLEFVGNEHGEYDGNPTLSCDYRLNFKEGSTVARVRHQFGSVGVPGNILSFALDFQPRAEAE